jgi:hypothetical protein
MHRTAARAVIGLSLLFAAGPAVAEQDPPRDEALTSILERIRQDIGYYQVQAARWRADISDPTDQGGQPHPPRPQPDAACDISDFDFDVTNVQANLQTVMAKTETGSVGLRVPLVGQEGSLASDVSRQASGTETISLTRRYRYNIEHLASYQASKDYQQLETAYQARNASEATQPNPVLPVADTLLELRKHLIRSAEKLPCFDWADKDGKSGSSSIALEFLVQQAVDGTVGFNFWIVSAKANAKIERTNVNTLVVNFAPHARPVPASPAVAQQFGQVPSQSEGMIR